MKRTLKYALTTVLGAALVVPALAQDNFPDVPENHWAFEALSKLKAAGLLVGYPDGLFRGGRMASRYELAVALHAAYQNLQNSTNGLAAQIEEIKRQLGGGGGGGTSGTGPVGAPDLQSIRDRLTQLENQINGLNALRDDVANLKRMADTFQRELQSLGVDVEAMKRDLGDLADRVRVLEERKPAIDFGGDVNFWVGAGTGTSGNVGLDMDGRINGSTTGLAGGASTGLTRDLTVLHEMALKLSGTNKEGPKWKGTIVVGNALSGGAGAGFGSLSTNSPAFGYRESIEDVYVNDFGVKFDTSIAGLGVNAEVGRIGYKLNSLMMQRGDRTSYYANERWDNGMYYFDGAVLGFGFGAAKIDVFGGRNTNRNSVNGAEMNAMITGPVNGMFSGAGGTSGPSLQVDRSLGVNFNMPLTSAGNLNLAYLWLDSNSPITASFANKLNVFGGGVDFNVGGIKLEGNFSQSDLMNNKKEVNTKNNRAYSVKGTYGSGSWGIWAAYREVEANYLAPGDWGRLGIMRNPTNIKGVQVGGHLNLTNALTVSAMGEFDKGKSNGAALAGTSGVFANGTGFNTNSKVNNVSVKLDYKLNPTTGIMLGYEETKFEKMETSVVAAGLKPTYKWTTFGVNYGLSDSAKLMVQYQVSDVKNDFILKSNPQFKGGLLTTQLSVKF